MKNPLLFEFVTDKATHSVFIKREFNADLPLVWDAFTKQEILDKWGAPEPWVTSTKRMDFRVGGHRLYAMLSPEGQEHWSIQEYTSISPMTNLQYISSFADSDGNRHPELQGSENNLDFNETTGITTVSITIKYKTLAILEMMIEKGFKEGFEMTMDNLENLLETVSQT